MQYRVNWEVRGITTNPLNAGDVIELEPEVAQPFVGGALTLVEDDAAEASDATADDPHKQTGIAPFPVEPSVESHHNKNKARSRR